MSNVLEQPRSERVAVRISPGLKEIADEMAQEDDVTLSKLLERLLKAEAVRRSKLQ